MQLRIKTKYYLKVKSQGQSVESNNVIENEIITETTLEPSETEVTISGNGEQENETNPGSGQGPSQQGQGQADGANLGSSLGPSPQGQGQNSDSSSSESIQVNSKLPRFSGDVREYFIFREDFKHAIEHRYTKRDAMTYLRACLQGKSLELVKGIGSDYDGAWQYLDSIYGDPRFVSDKITQDLSKFRPLKEGEDSRFCD